MKRNRVWCCLAGLGLSLFFVQSLDAADVGRKQAKIKGLLVMEIGNGEFAGTASQMNATVIRKDSVDTIEVAFNQDVGEMMNKATKEVVKFMNVRHEEIPNGYRVELAFADKYSPKDGPSAAVATALLVDSIITGKVLNADFAVTGDMNATGEVRPVGGVMAKVRGASKRCKLVAIPYQNEQAIEDALIIEGVPFLAAIQIFSIKHFDEAYAIAGEQSSKTEKAIADFSAVQKALSRNPKYLYNPKVRAKLVDVLEAMPNHLSADLLLKHSHKKGPKYLSLSGSILAIDNASVDFSKMMKNQQFMERGGENDVLTGFIYDLRELRKKIDPRVKRYSDSYLELAEYIKSVRQQKRWSQQNQSDLRRKVASMRGEREKLLANREVREELMMD